MKLKIFLFLICLLSVGFSQTSTSSISISDAKSIAKQILLTNPEWKIGNISDTKSMFPTLDFNSVVILEPVKINTKLNVNDIVLFNDADRTNILHRIVQVVDDGFIIKGDNTTMSDGKIKKENILYRVVIIINTSGL